MIPVHFKVAKMSNKSIACGCQRSAVGCLIEDKKSKSKKGHNSEIMTFELSPFIVWIALGIVKTYTEFKVNIVCNNRDIIKYQRFYTAITTITTTQMLLQYLAFFPENSRARNDLLIFNPKQQILHSSKLKEFADDNLKFEESGRKFSKRVENSVGKGEIARYEQFLLFPQCFQKTCTADT